MVHSKRSVAGVLVASALLVVLTACNPKPITDPVTTTCDAPWAISADGRYVVTSGPDTPIVIRDSFDNSNLALLPAGLAQSVSARAEVVTYQDAATGRARYWLRATGVSADLPVPPGRVSTWVGAASVSADGNIIMYAARTATGHERLYVYDRGAGTTSFVPYSASSHGKLSADGHYVAYLSETNTVNRLDLGSGHAVQVIGSVDAVGLEPIKAISGDGQVVAWNTAQAGLEEQIYLWDAASGTTSWGPWVNNGLDYDVSLGLDSAGTVITWSQRTQQSVVRQYDRNSDAETIVDASAGNASASVDGTRIAYCRRTGSGTSATYRTYLWTRP